jgi:hypothetical protein
MKRQPRNPFEQRLWAQLRPTKRAAYEAEYINYVLNETRRYLPDFILKTKRGKKIFIEGKGKFTSIDRKKMQLVKAQYPDYDIRFVFYRAKAKIRKGSQTTHAMWAEKNGFPWADKAIPKEWISE